MTGKIIKEGIWKNHGDDVRVWITENDSSNTEGKFAVWYEPNTKKPAEHVGDFKSVDAALERIKIIGPSGSNVAWKS